MSRGVTAAFLRVLLMLMFMALISGTESSLVAKRPGLWGILSGRLISYLLPVEVERHLLLKLHEEKTRLMDFLDFE